VETDEEAKKTSGLSEFFSVLSKEKDDVRQKIKERIDDPESGLSGLFLQLEEALQDTKKVSVEEDLDNTRLSDDDHNKLENLSNLLNSLSSDKQIPIKVEPEEIIPEEIIPEELVVESEEPQDIMEPQNEIIASVIRNLDDMSGKTQVKEEVDQISSIRKEFDNFRSFISQQIGSLQMSGAGSGETRLEFLDDVDRDTAKVNGKALVYSSSDGKWKGESVLTGAITGLDIDGGTDIGAALADADLIIVDDGAGGTNRKAALSRLKTYIGAGAADDLGAGDAAVTLTTTSGNITIDAAANNSDIIFKGTDGGADITMLTLDGSADGAAIFKSTVTATAFVGDITGDVTGNADTATTLATARTIGGVSFNGSANINLPGVNSAGNQDTSGTAALATTVTVTDSIANTNFPVVFTNESNALLDDTGALRYNPSSGTLLVPNLVVAGTTTSVYAVLALEPKLVFDFTGNVFKTGGASSNFGASITHSRASSATMINASGTLVTVGNNVPRTGHHIYNGSAWVNEGILHESEARTNLIGYSGDLTQSSAGWAGGATIGAVTTGSPFGTYQTISPSSNGTNIGTAQRYQIGKPLTPGSTYVGWALVKHSVGSGWFRINMYDTGKGNELAYFDLQNGVVGSKEALIIDHGMVDYGDGWWLCWASANAASGSGGLSVEMPNDDGVETSSAADVILIAGAQLELGATPSSYIPTTTSTVTRAAETLTVSAANLPYDSTNMSIQIDGKMTGDTLTPVRWLLDANNSILLETGTNNFSFTQEAGGTVDTVTGGSFTGGTNVTFNLATRNGSTFINSAISGTSLTADTTPTALPNLSATDLILGYDFMGTIGQFRMWDEDLGDAGITVASIDGSAADGGLSIAADAVIGDDIIMLSDAAQIAFGTNSEITLAHVHNVGLNLKHTATADDKPIILTLQTGETDMAANDVMGKIAFQAPDEGTGTDAVLVAAAIQARAEGDFSSSSNATSLDFMTGASEAATTKMSITSAGLVGIGTTAPAVPLDVVGNIRSSTGILFGTDTAAANLLDDYEEGDWTPTIGTGTTVSTDAAYNASFTAGKYTKVGRVVHCTATLRLTDKGSQSGDISILGLPFASANNVGSRATWSSWFHGGADVDLTGNTAGMIMMFQSHNTSHILVRVMDPAGTAGENVEFADISDTVYVQISGSYVTA
jgi:hypothetical protein